MNFYRLNDDCVPVLSKLPRHRILRHTHIGGVLISTVFLGVDHDYFNDDGSRPPLVFETMILGGAFNGEQHRHRTFDAAMLQHKTQVIRVYYASPWWAKLGYLLMGG